MFLEGQPKVIDCHPSGEPTGNVPSQLFWRKPSDSPDGTFPEGWMRVKQMFLTADWCKRLNNLNLSVSICCVCSQQLLVYYFTTALQTPPLPCYSSGLLPYVKYSACITQRARIMFDHPQICCLIRKKNTKLFKPKLLNLRKWSISDNKIINNCRCWKAGFVYSTLVILTLWGGGCFCVYTTGRDKSSTPPALTSQVSLCSLLFYEWWQVSKQSILVLFIWMNWKKSSWCHLALVSDA